MAVEQLLGGLQPSCRGSKCDNLLHELMTRLGRFAWQPCQSRVNNLIDAINDSKLRTARAKAAGRDTLKSELFGGRLGERTSRLHRKRSCADNHPN